MENVENIYWGEDFLNMEVKQSPEFKSIKVSDETHAKILRCGKMGQSMDEVISMVFDYYIQRELTVKTKK